MATTHLSDMDTLFDLVNDINIKAKAMENIHDAIGEILA